MELKIINDEGKPTSSVNASDELFGRDYNEPLIHQVIRQLNHIPYAAFDSHFRLLDRINRNTNSSYYAFSFILSKYGTNRISIEIRKVAINPGKLNWPVSFIVIG